VFSLGEGYGCTFTVDIPITIRINSITNTNEFAWENLYIIENNTYEIGRPNDVLCGNLELFTYNNNSNNSDDFNAKYNNEMLSTSLYPSGPSTPSAGTNNIHKTSTNNNNYISSNNNTSTTTTTVTTSNNNNAINNEISTPNTLNEIESPNLILIVDDSVGIRKMQNRLLTSYNYTCMEAKDGSDALNKVRENMKTGIENQFHVILMDYQMPIMDGPTAIQLIRAEGYKGLIIGVTGNVLSEDVKTMLNAGADYVMNKPFDLNKFESIIKGKVCEK
jgi:CheY-like chemotaxis protein